MYYHNNLNFVYYCLETEETIPPEWREVNHDIVLPYKIDTFPRPDSEEIEVWVLGGLFGNEAYQGYYNPKGRASDINFIKRDTTNEAGVNAFKDITIGESGVWALDEIHRAVYFNKDTKTWNLIPDGPEGKISWKYIESGSPNVVYGIELNEGKLYFRSGITPEIPQGTKWINTGIKAEQVSTNPFVTYIITTDNEFKSFTSAPTSSNLKTWVTSLVTHNQAIPNKLSVGFGNSMVYLDDKNILFVRDPLLLKNEQFGSIWEWNKLGVPLSDVSAGPVVFGIFKDKLVAYKTGTIVHVVFSF